MNSVEFTQKPLKVYLGMFTNTTAGEFSRRSHNEADISDFENMDTASSDDETLI